MRLSDARKHHAAWLRGQGHQPRGIQRYETQLADFQESVGDIHLERISKRHVTRYLTKLGERCSPNTVQVAISACRSLCNWAQDQGMCENNPATDIAWPRRKRTLPNLPSRQAMKQLIVAMQKPPQDVTVKQQWEWDRNQLAVIMLLKTGIRIAELQALTWAHIDLDSKTIMVRGGKNGKDRSIPMHTTLFQLLCHQTHQRTATAVVAKNERGEPFSRPDVLGRLLTKWVERLIGERITPHKFRHSFALELLRNNADLRRIQELLGHDSLETTQKYLHIDSEWLREAIDLLPDDRLSSADDVLPDDDLPPGGGLFDEDT